MPTTDTLTKLHEAPAFAPMPVTGSEPVPVPSKSGGWNPGHAGMGLALFLTLLVVYFHVLFRQEAGGLWRDEANSVQLATLPAFSETWDNLQFDSFPILFFTLLRGWGALFSPSNDAAFRDLGLLIGLGVFAALWFNARRFGCRWPVLSLVLLGFNPLFIRYADSMRAYGLGILLMILTFGAIWRVVESLSVRRVLAATVLAVLSVQTIYYNSVLLFAMCVGGAAAAAYARQWKKAACILGIGAPAAASLLLYAETIRRLNEWNVLVHYSVTPAWLWKKLSDVTGSPEPAGVWIWTLLAVGACVLAGRQIFRRRPEAGESLVEAGGTQLACVFAATSLIVGTVGYAVFLFVLRYATEPWYYISYLALAAVCLDVIFGRALETGHAAAANRWRLTLAAVTAAAAVFTFFSTRDDLLARQTNADLVAARVSREAVKGDLIVHLHWEYAVSFARYYRGAAEQISVPLVTDHRFHRYDQVFKQMQTPDPMRPALEQVAATLKAGHKVWLTGGMAALFVRKPPRLLPPASKGPAGWQFGGPYYANWGQQVVYLLQMHAMNAGTIDLSQKQPVMEYEDVDLDVVEGWR